MRGNNKWPAIIVILDKINRNIKELEIIGSIIKVSSSEKDCSIVNQTKFPELVNEFRILSKTINPLRAKLDLPPSSDLKPICN